MNIDNELELLVQEIERLLTPDGLKVARSEKIFNDEGVQIAEFDILITGDIGSSSINWLIECRDRPSSGSAPRSWIEQLIGRQRLHNFDRVFAVSTTGFAPGAIEATRQGGIILRTVQEVSELSARLDVLKNFASSRTSRTLTSPRSNCATCPTTLARQCRSRWATPCSA